MLGKSCLKKALLRLNTSSFFLDKHCKRNMNAAADSAPVKNTSRYTFLKCKLFIEVVSNFFYFYLLAK